MTNEERASRIKTLTLAKDKLEQALTMLEGTGATKFYGPHREITKAIADLRTDLWGLQTGRFPYATVNSPLSGIAGAQ